jgi:transposase
VFLVMIASVKALGERIRLLDREITKRAREDETARRLMTIPGIGSITATELVALAPPPESFRKGS